MNWRPKGFTIDTKSLVKGIFDGSSDESRIIDLAAMGEVELFAESRSWNAILWLIMSTLKDDSGQPVYSGEQLGKIRDCLPIVFR